MSQANRHLQPLIVSALGVGALATATLGCLDLPDPEPREVDVVVAVLDLSSSSAYRDRCFELLARINDQLTISDRSLEVLGLATGSPASNSEPTRLVGWATFAPERRLFEGREAVVLRRTFWLSTVLEACQANLHRKNHSPIFRAVRRAVEAIRARCAEVEGRGMVCRPHLWLHSDLLEARLFNQRNNRKKGDIAPLATAEIDIRVCGVAQTNGLGTYLSHVSPNVVRDKWKQLLGPGAAETIFAPTCAVMNLNTPPRENGGSDE